MGAGNVKSVYASWGHLKDRPMRLLVFMALTALDRDDTPRYFGGWKSLALSGLGRQVPDIIDDATRKEADAIKQDVKRTIQALRHAGAITLLNTPKIGDQANYELHLKPLPQSSTGGQHTYPTQDEEGYSTRTPEGDSTCTPGGVQNGSKEGYTTCTPKEETPKEEGQDLEQDTTRSPKVTDLSSARARTRAAARAGKAAR